MAKQAAVLTFIVVHGSVSGKKVGEEIELTQEQADHLNSSGKILRGIDEPEAPRERAETGVRVGLDGKKKTVKLQGDVIDKKADAEAFEPGPDVNEPAEEEEKKPAKKTSKKKGGG